MKTSFAFSFNIYGDLSIQNQNNRLFVLILAISLIEISFMIKTSYIKSFDNESRNRSNVDPSIRLNG